MNFSVKPAIFRIFAALLSILLVLSAVPLRALAEHQVYRSVKTNSMQIAITFDDGPHPTLTPEILKILDRYHVQATFFMVGVNVQNYPDAARAVIAAGHEVGNHTFTHGQIGRLSAGEVSREVGDCETVLEELCEYRPHLFRPPQGVVNEAIERCSRDNDYDLILWSLDTRDWENKNTDEIVERVLSTVTAGDIILMHDYIGHHSKTPEALEILLPKLLERGFEPVTVSRLLAAG